MSLFRGRRSDAPGPADAGPPASSTRDARIGARQGEAGSGLAPAKQNRRDGTTVTGEGMANIGKSISIKGDLTGNEDLLIEGNVDGKIDLSGNELIIGPEGKINANLTARSIVIAGRVKGNVTATDRAEIQATGIVEGDVCAPRLILGDGAGLRGSVEMGTPPAEAAAASRPAASASGVPARKPAPPQPGGAAEHHRSP